MPLGSTKYVCSCYHFYDTRLESTEGHNQFFSNHLFSDVSVKGNVEEFGLYAVKKLPSRSLRKTLTKMFILILLLKADYELRYSTINN